MLLKMRISGQRPLLFKVLILGIFLVCSQILYPYAAPSSWASRSVIQLEFLGILKGQLADADKMQTQITREEFAEIAVQLYLYVKGSAFESLSTVNTFTDTKNPYVGAAYQLGIIKGFDVNTFGPKSLVTREQIATMLHREVMLLNLATTYGVSQEFVDQGKISGYAKESVAFSRYHQLIQGMSGNKFEPQGKATREQVYKIIEGIVTQFNLGVSKYDSFTGELNGYLVPSSAKTQLVLSERESTGIVLRIQSGPMPSQVLTPGINQSERSGLDIQRQWLEIYDILIQKWPYASVKRAIRDLKGQWSSTDLSYSSPRLVYIDAQGKLTTVKPVSKYIQIDYRGTATITIYK